MMIGRFRNIGIHFALGTTAFGQATSPLLTSTAGFEVASVRPAVRKAAGSGARVGPNGMGGSPGACPTSVKIDQGRVAVRCANVAMLIGYAYRLAPDRIAGPDSVMGVGAPRFDIEATIPQNASQNKIPEMFQALLADRFKLVVHRGVATQPVLALVAAMGGTKLTVAASEASAPATAAVADSDPGSPAGIESFAGEVHDSTTRNADGSREITTVSSPRIGTARWTASSNNRNWRLEASSITSGGLAELLNRVVPLPSPVVDMTQLKGRYRMILDISLQEALGENGSMMERDDAVLRGFNNGLKRLGLQLERRKGPVETLFVDHVQNDPTGNLNQYFRACLLIQIAGHKHWPWNAVRSGFTPRKIFSALALCPETWEAMNATPDSAQITQPRNPIHKFLRIIFAPKIRRFSLFSPQFRPQTRSPSGTVPT